MTEDSHNPSDPSAPRAAPAGSACASPAWLIDAPALVASISVASSLPHRSFLLLEVMVGLALLAGLGVALLKLQADSVRQYRSACQRAAVAERVEQLLWEWSAAQVPVTLPASGPLGPRRAWRREVQPLRVGPGVVATQVRVVVTQTDPGGREHEVYRVAWLVPPAPAKGRNP